MIIFKVITTKYSIFFQKEDICTTLWCRLDNKCTTRLEAAAEGTICGAHKVRAFATGNQLATLPPTSSYHYMWWGFGGGVLKILQLCTF